MKNYLLLFLLFLFACTDPSQSGTKYPTISNLDTLARLPKSVSESSGLIYWQKGLWTLNDGGNKARLIQVGIYEKQKLRNVKVQEIKNIDWEAFAQDSSFVYIGDFGNNDGNRENLAIHLIEKNELALASEEVSIDSSIAFRYADRKLDWLPSKQHNFDCEAMVTAGDSIYLFSKNHGNHQCKLYRLPKTPGEHEAVLIDRFDTNGLITGASWVEEKRCLVLLGYDKWGESHRPFLWFFSNFPGYRFFSGKSQRVNLSERLQMEGIAHYSGNRFLLTNETEGGKKGHVYLFDASEWLE